MKTQTLGFVICTKKGRPIYWDGPYYNMGEGVGSSPEVRQPTTFHHGFTIYISERAARKAVARIMGKWVSWARKHEPMSVQPLNVGGKFDPPTVPDKKTVWDRLQGL